MSTQSLKSILVTLATLSDENLSKVKEFMETLIKPTSVLDPILPTEMTIGDRTYEILNFCKKGECITDNTMVYRAKNLDANLGQEDCQYILDHQDEIPAALRDKVYFVFPNYRHPDYSEYVAYVYWSGGHWIQVWDWLDGSWVGVGRVLCRKPAAAGK